MEQGNLWRHFLLRVYYGGNIKVKELQLEMNNTEENRKDLMKTDVELQKFYQLEEEYWRQKSGMKWFNNGDRNIKFFHSDVKGRRRKLKYMRLKMNRE